MFTTEVTSSIREAVICPFCRLHQYSMPSGQHAVNTKCCRCGQPLGITYYKFQASGICGEGGVSDRMSIQRSIGSFVRRLRMQRHISQEMLAQRMAMHRTVITKVEGGHFRNLAVLLRAAAALDLEIDQVLVRVRDRRSLRP